MIQELDWSCPGNGECHGCVRWCPNCGDVSATCPHPTCMAHHCVECSRLASVSDGICYRCKVDGEIDRESMRFDKALAHDDIASADIIGAHVVALRRHRAELA